jgi:paraquat-inducible protein B
VTLARPRLVGVFVVGGLMLALAGIAALSTRRYFAEYRTYVVFFPYAVGGLRGGAPVTFRQVPVGTVRDVDLVFNGTAFRESRIMAVIEVRRSAFRNLAGEAATYSDRELAQLMVEAGLRASVRSSSPIAGQKSVDLDFQPDQPPRVSGIPAPYPEIPSAPSGMEVINERIEATLKKMSSVPVDEVLLQLGSTLAAAQKALDQGDVPGTLRQLRVTLDTGSRTLTRADQAMGNVDGLAVQARTTLTSVDTSMQNLKSTLDQLNHTLQTMDRNVEGMADVRVEATRSLDELNETLKSVRSLVETLQRHPEALLRGKAAPSKEK